MTGMVSQLSSPSLVLPVWPGWVAWLLLMACIQPVWSQVSGHQRLGVESKANWEASIELAARLNPAGYADYGLPCLDSSLSLGLLLDRRWSASISVPVSVPGWAGTTAPLLVIPGDVTVSAGWTAIHGDNRFRGAFNLTGPSALWQGNQEVPGPVAGGSGGWTLGLSGAVSRIMDPLVLSGFLSWSAGLPRAERWVRMWHPGDFALVLSVTEAFNEHVACTLGLSQYASLPECAWGTTQASSWGSLPYGTVGYDASAGIDFLLSRQPFTLGIGFSKGIVHGADPGSLNFSVGYNLRQKEGP